MTSSIFSQIILPLCLFIIMFGMGLSLQIADFTRVGRYPKAVLIGTFGQMVLLPLAGFAVAAWLMPSAALAIGLVLLAACPGGTTSNLVTYLARGDLALSITLTAISSLLTIFTIPLIVSLAFLAFADASTEVQVPVGTMMAALFAITLLPVMLGMVLRAKAGRLAAWLEPKINLFGALFLVFLIIVITAKQGDRIVTQVASSGVATLVLNVFMMSMGFLAARGFRLNADQSTSITIEIGVQNSTLAIMVATSFLANPEIAVPAAVYSITMYLTGAVVIGLRHRQRRQASKLAAPLAESEV
ncbi:bile acid:sodium symporter family protein [Marinobacter fonticola]|uniref:bile acid:sodium symporter family protein n=1 Tax=Marinobacter fonticola TaxID=2603215 RepID=UPI0011E84441|nr:bile acid:sodium symporter family protein [Marinobacter fonticola]